MKSLCRWWRLQVQSIHSFYFTDLPVSNYRQSDFPTPPNYLQTLTHHCEDWSELLDGRTWLVETRQEMAFTFHRAPLCLSDEEMYRLMYHTDFVCVSVIWRQNEIVLLLVVSKLTQAKKNGGLFSRCVNADHSSMLYSVKLSNTLSNCI